MDNEKGSSTSGDKESCKSPTFVPKVLTPPSTPGPSSSIRSDCEPAKKKKKESKFTKENCEIENIIRYRVEKNDDIWYFVKWKGLSNSYNTWEKLETLKGCNRMLMIYFEGTRESQENIEEMDEEIEDSLADYVMYQMLEDSDYLPKYLDMFSEECLDLTPLFKNESIDSFVAEAQKQYSYVVRALCGMAHHRDRQMFKRGQDYFILLKICDLRKKQLNQLKEVERNINSLETCLITVENTVDLEHYPDNVEYITETKVGKDVEMLTDPLIGCDCPNGCNIRSLCCGKMSKSEFAYNSRGKLRLPRHSFIYECNSRCDCDNDCPNRVVQHGRKIKLGIFKTKACGWGVKTLEEISKGTFVCEFIGELIKDSEAVVRDIEYYKQGFSYLFDLDFNEAEDDSLLHCIDATSCGNLGRFINHSCDPNLLVYPVWVNCMDPNLPQLGFFSKRHINENEEIHFDYESLEDAEEVANPIRAISKIKCVCNAENCRGWVFGNK